MLTLKPQRNTTYLGFPRVRFARGLVTPCGFAAATEVLDTPAPRRWGRLAAPSFPPASPSVSVSRFPATSNNRLLFRGGPTAA